MMTKANLPQKIMTQKKVGLRLYSGRSCRERREQWLNSSSSFGTTKKSWHSCRILLRQKVHVSLPEQAPIESNGVAASTGLASWELFEAGGKKGTMADEDWLWAVDRVLNEPLSKFDRIYWTVAFWLIVGLVVCMIWPR